MKCVAQIHELLQLALKLTGKSEASLSRLKEEGLAKEIYYGMK